VVPAAKLVAVMVCPMAIAPLVGVVVTVIAAEPLVIEMIAPVKPMIADRFVEVDVQGQRSEGARQKIGRGEHRQHGHGGIDGDDRQLDLLIDLAEEAEEVLVAGRCRDRAVFERIWARSLLSAEDPCK